MSQTIPSERPFDLDRTEPSVAPEPGRLLPFLRPPTEPDEIGRLAGYRVLRFLAEGGMGKVFLAEDIALGRRAALKVLQPHLEQILPGSFERFLREARAMASIKHDNLVTVYSAGQDGDTVYLAMELLQGETLERRLDRAGPLPPEDVARIGREIAIGLAAVHERHLIHRDIKPANLWLEAPSGRVKILDFGLVRGTEADRGLTVSGVVVGTPAYLSPEQIRGEAFDARADLFSLGCVLYRMCTNKLPFPATTAMAQLTAVVINEAVEVTDLNPALPPDLADLIMQLIAKDPTMRPATAGEVADRLLRTKRGLTGAKKRVRGETAGRAGRTRPPGPARRKAGGGRPRWVWVALACALFIPLAVLGAVALRKPSSPKHDDKRNAAERSAEATSAGPHGPKLVETEFLTNREIVDRVNWPFRNPIPGTNGQVIVGRRVIPHGIFMHALPPHENPPSITFQLGRLYSRLSGTVGFNDSAPPDPAPATFAIFLGGQEKWRSQELYRRDQTEAFDLDVTGAEVVRIELRVQGHPHGCHGVWVDPLLTK